MLYVVTIDVPNPPQPSEVKIVHIGTDWSTAQAAWSDAVNRRSENVQIFSLDGERLQ